MTKRQCKKLLRKDTVPIILGNSAKAHRLSLSLRFRYGLFPVLCAQSRNLWDFLDPFSSFFPLISASSRLTYEQLYALAERYEDCLLLLIPSSPKESERLEDVAEKLETVYILADPLMPSQKIPDCLRLLHSHRT